MKFLTWTLSVIYFALTESAPTSEQPANNLNFTNEINIGLGDNLLYLNLPYRNISKDDLIGKKEFYNHTINGILYNVTVIYETLGSIKLELPSHENDTFKSSGQLPFIFVEGYIRDSNQHIVTDKIKVDYVSEVTPQNGVNTEFPNFNLDKIHLHVSNYQYKPNEEIQIKKEIQTLIMEKLQEVTAQAQKYEIGVNVEYSNLLEKLSLIHNKQEHYYFIDTIPSTNYTLNNVTINGLWNVLSISMNQFNMSAMPEIEMSGVRGSMVQSFPSKSEELSFKADKIYFSVDRNTRNNGISKVNVKVEAYSVENNKLNNSLPDDESKLIISEIESAFAASLDKARKNYFERYMAKH